MPANTLKHTRLFGGRGHGGVSVRIRPARIPTSAPTAASNGTRLPTLPRSGTARPRSVCAIWIQTTSATGRRTTSSPTRRAGRVGRAYVKQRPESTPGSEGEGVPVAAENAAGGIKRTSAAGTPPGDRIGAKRERTAPPPQRAPPQTARAARPNAGGLRRRAGAAPGLHRAGERRSAGGPRDGRGVAHDNHAEEVEEHEAVRDFRVIFDPFEPLHDVDERRGLAPRRFQGNAAVLGRVVRVAVLQKGDVDASRDR